MPQEVLYTILAFWIGVVFGLTVSRLFFSKPKSLPAVQSRSTPGGAGGLGGRGGTSLPTPRPYGVMLKGDIVFQGDMWSAKKKRQDLINMGEDAVLIDTQGRDRG